MGPWLFVLVLWGLRVLLCPWLRPFLLEQRAALAWMQPAGCGFFCLFFFFFWKEELGDSDASPPLTQDSFWERVFPRVGEALTRCRMRCGQPGARGKGMLRSLQGSCAVVSPKPSVQVWASAGAVC